MAAQRLVVPMVHHLFHRPAPRPEVLPDGRIRWTCSCGETWVE